MSRGLLLYGPPASGKDSVTEALADTGAFRLFRRLKAGAGRTATYRMTSSDHLAKLAASGEVLWQNSRYGATYVVDRSEIVSMVGSGAIPVIHLGQPDAVDAIRTSMPEVQWTTVELWCPRSEAAQRIRQRATGDTAARLSAWDTTPRLEPEQVDLSIDTSRHEPKSAAAKIIRAMKLP